MFTIRTFAWSFLQGKNKWQAQLFFTHSHLSTLRATSKSLSYTKLLCGFMNAMDEVLSNKGNLRMMWKCERATRTFIYSTGCDNISRWTGPLTRATHQRSKETFNGLEFSSISIKALRQHPAGDSL